MDILALLPSEFWRRRSSRTPAAGHPDYTPDRKTLNEDRENDDEVREGQHQTPRGARRQGQRHGHRDTTAQTAPGEERNRPFRLRLYPAERPDDSRDAQPARRQHDRYGEHSCQQPPSFDSKHEKLQADQEKEDDVENLVHELPEGVDVFTGLL